MTNEAYGKEVDPSNILAEIVHPDGREPAQFTVGQAQTLELEKFLEDVR